MRVVIDGMHNKTAAFAVISNNADAAVFYRRPDNKPARLRQTKDAAD
jgi:hypothetical protein